MKDINDVIIAAREAVPVSPRLKEYDDESIAGMPYALLRNGERIEPLVNVVEAYEDRRENPSRRHGVSTHTELDSFVEHINRHKEKRSTVWADGVSMNLVAVYNYDPAGNDPKAAGWCDHRAQYTMPLAKEWCEWINNAGRSMGSEAFAEFIDNHVDDLTTGEGCAAPVELLEVARDLQVHVKGTFIKKINPDTGEYHMVAKEEHTQETTKIPRKFALALRVFEGGDMYRVEARIQFRIAEGKPYFTYALPRAGEITRDAFGDVRKKVKEQTGLPVFAGCFAEED